MGAIVAAVSKREENIVPQAVTMLKELVHRGLDTQIIVTPNSVKSVKQTENVTANLNSNILLGHNSTQFSSAKKIQSILGKGYTFVFEGQIFPPSDIIKIETLLKKTIPKRIQIDCAKIINECEGSYTFGATHSYGLVLGRDHLGVTPLYYGENETLCAAASEQKALWNIGIKNAKSFPPGNLAKIDANGFVFQKVRTIGQPNTKVVSIEQAAKHLQKLLSDATKNRVSGVEKVAIAFSGGLDSSIIAVLAKIYGQEVHLVSVGLSSQEEVQHAKEVAETLDMPHHVKTFEIEQVKGALSKVVWLIEQKNVINVGIAIPFYFCAETASQIGCHIMLAGQGSDELFGGYRRYLGNYKASIATLKESLYNDILFSYETNFQRDNPVCEFHKVDLRLPFVDSNVIDYALSLPIGLKIESAEDSLRKRVLRRVAENLKLPSSVIYRRKKAIQYATGVDKVLRKLAKEKRLTLKKYIEEIFRKVYPEVEI